jgi:hypothetical protein
MDGASAQPNGGHRHLAERARPDICAEHRKRTWHLIDLGALVVRAGIVNLATAALRFLARCYDVPISFEMIKATRRERFGEQSASRAFKVTLATHRKTDPTDLGDRH